MMSCLSLDLDPRTEMYPDRSSMAMRAWVLPPMEAVVSSWRSKNTQSPTLGDGGEELVTWRSMLCILPAVHARQEP